MYYLANSMIADFRLPIRRLRRVTFASDIAFEADLDAALQLINRRVISTVAPIFAGRLWIVNNQPAQGLGMLVACGVLVAVSRTPIKSSVGNVVASREV